MFFCYSGIQFAISAIVVAPLDPGQYFVCLMVDKQFRSLPCNDY